MNKLVIFTLGFIAGSGVGFAVGCYITKKQRANVEYMEPIYIEKEVSNKVEEPKPENPQKEIPNFTPAKIATKPGEVGINYTKMCKDLQYKMETTGPSEDDSYDDDDDGSEDDMDMSEYEETFEERLERENNETIAHAEEYRKAHKGKIELMTSDEWDTDFPETDYEREDLYYFTSSDVITDGDGHILNETEFVGPKVRQVGWMQSSDAYIYVRNHPKEKEYRVCKETCAVEDWF